MKEQVQDIGIRPWFGDDIVSIQNEVFDALQAHFASIGTAYVLQGCTVTNKDIAPGLVFLEGKIRRFAGATDVRSLPVYMIAKDEETDLRNYETGGAKPCAKIYGVTLTEEMPLLGEFIKLDARGARGYFEAIQNAQRRFVTDLEKGTWSGKAEKLHRHTMSDVDGLTAKMDSYETVEEEDVNIKGLEEYVEYAKEDLSSRKADLSNHNNIVTTLHTEVEKLLGNLIAARDNVLRINNEKYAEAERLLKDIEYKSGTWTPVVLASNGYSFPLKRSTGTFVRRGNRVQLTFYIEFKSSHTYLNCLIKGFPFPSSTTGSVDLSVFSVNDYNYNINVKVDATWKYDAIHVRKEGHIYNTVKIITGSGTYRIR